MKLFNVIILKISEKLQIPIFIVLMHKRRILNCYFRTKKKCRRYNISGTLLCDLCLVVLPMHIAPTKPPWNISPFHCHFSSTKYVFHAYIFYAKDSISARPASAVDSLFLPLFCVHVHSPPLNTTTMLGNGALFLLPPNFNRPCTNLISAL